MPRRRKLHILRFAFSGKSSVASLLLLSPPNPLRWASAGPHFALLPRTRLYCNMCDKNVGTERITGLICSRKLGGCVNLSFFLGTRSTQRQGDKRSAAADVIASNAPLRNGSHTVRQVSTKTLPKGIQGDRNPLGTPFSPIFLQTKKDGVPEGR